MSNGFLIVPKSIAEIFKINVEYFAVAAQFGFISANDAI